MTNATQPAIVNQIVSQRAMPRGLRNNNPLNIRRGTAAWIGSVDADYALDLSFCEFVSMAYGFRAAFRLLNTYYRHYHLRTLDDIVRRWAPAADGNRPRLYAEHVARRASQISGQQLTTTSQLPPLRPWDLSELHREQARQLWIAIALAMAEVENGSGACAACKGLEQAAADGLRMAFAEN